MCDPGLFQDGHPVELAKRGIGLSRRCVEKTNQRRWDGL